MLYLAKYSFVRRSVEILLSLLLVLAAFAVFLEFLNAIFPSGIGISSMIQNSTIFRDRKNDRYGIDLYLKTGDTFYDLSASHPLKAVLIDMQKKVKSKRANAIAWEHATKGMKLYDRDSIQTLKRSSAYIQFEKHSFVKLSENSLIVIRKYEEDKLLQEKRSTLLLLAGELSGTVNRAKQNTTLQLFTPGGAAYIQAPKKSDKTEYKIKINSKKSSTLTVYSGLAEIISHGKKIQIKPNHSITIDTDKPPSSPVRIPDPIQVISPEHKKTIYYNKITEEVVFQWRSQEAIFEYRFLLARDSQFKNTVVDEITTRSHFKHGRLKAGTYFWKVSGKNAATEGDYSETRKLTLERDTEPPILIVDFPPQDFLEAMYLITGKTEKGATLFIASKIVPVDGKGDFSLRYDIKPGINVIVVEAIDAVGNINYQSKVVNRRE